MLLAGVFALAEREIVEDCDKFGGNRLHRLKPSEEVLHLKSGHRWAEMA